MTRHRDSPLVQTPGPGRRDGRGNKVSQLPGDMRPPQRMPYHASTAEVLESDPSAVPMTHNQAQAYVNGWRPKRPALFAMNEVIDCPVAVFGRLPRGFLTRIALPMLRCPRQEVLHVCSGSLREKYTVDIRPEVKPWLVADGAALPLADESFAAVLLDPPYVPAWARQYGTKYPPTYPLLREAARVVRPGGRIGILHFLVPFPPKGTKLVKVFGVSVGMGYQMRAFTVYERIPLPRAGAVPPTPRAAATQGGEEDTRCA